MADQGRIINMWMSKSFEDLRAANLLLDQGSENFLGPCVFHAQQSAEKAIKGYLAFKKNPFFKNS